jgi:hypothetical protein
MIKLSNYQKEMLSKHLDIAIREETAVKEYRQYEFKEGYLNRRNLNWTKQMLDRFVESKTKDINELKQLKKLLKLK